MIDRKFNVPLIIMSVAALGLGFISLSAESILLGIITIIASVKLREKYLIKIPVAICILAIVLSAAFLALLIWHESQHMSSSDYWLMRLIFGKMR